MRSTQEGLLQGEKGQEPLKWNKTQLNSSLMMKRATEQPQQTALEILLILLYIRAVQEDPEKEGRLGEHPAHQQPPQVQEGKGNLPASRIPNTVRTTWTGKLQTAAASNPLS